MQPGKAVLVCGRVGGKYELAMCSLHINMTAINRDKYIHGEKRSDEVGNSSVQGTDNFNVERGSSLWRYRHPLTN